MDSASEACSGAQTGPAERIRTHHVTVCDNASLVECAAIIAHQHGFTVTSRREPFTGETNQVSQLLLDEFSELLASSSATWIAYIAGGETQSLPGSGALGGRCQHLAASWIQPLHNLGLAACAAFSSDGQDFLPGVAGAVVNSNSYSEVLRAGLDLNGMLLSYRSFDIHNLLETHITPSNHALNVGIW